jgi:hypothetical protein
VPETTRDEVMLRDAEVMEVFVQGKDGEWDDEIRAKWETAKASWAGTDPTYVFRCNYFRPRASKHEHDKGCPDEGFVYTTTDWKVVMVVINGDD